MPTYDGATVYLISQYDARICPEYSPGKPLDPFIEDVKLYEKEKRTINVYTPVYPNSQLWVAYDMKPPYTVPEVKYYYFKLFINGRQIVSWGCGEEQKWQGKTMFGMYASCTLMDRKWVPCIETRTFSFGRGEDGNDTTEPRQDFIEIRMFRAKARKRTDPEMQGLAESQAADLDHHRDTRWDDASSSIGLFNRGPLFIGQPKRFYKYALLDPVDVPHITFRFHYRPLPQLERLGVCALDELEEMIAAENARRPPGEPIPSRLNEPKLIPSISLHSILSATSPSEVPKMPRYPVFALTRGTGTSPSPFRVPAFLKMTPHQLAQMSLSTNNLSSQTKDSLESDDEQESTKSPSRSRPSIYLNDNRPLLATNSPGAGSRLSRKLHKEAPRKPRLDKIPMLQPRPSKEQLFRNTVSTLLEQPPRPQTPVPPETSPTRPPRRVRLFSRASNESLRSNQADNPPRRSTSAMSNNSVGSTHSSGGGWMNDILKRAKSRAEEKAKADELSGSPTKREEAPHAAHQLSMALLNGVLSSATKRQDQSKGETSCKGKATAKEI